MSEDTKSKALATTEKREISVGSRGLRLSTMDDMWRFAQAVVKSGTAPRGMERAETVLVAIQMGAELGISPMSAVQNIAVINNRPSLWGDLVKGMVDADPDCEDFEEWIDGEPFSDDWTAHCRILRRGRSKPFEQSFSVREAKRAGLWDERARVQKKRRDGGTYEGPNDSPWYKYPRRMLQMRARSWCCRDAFPDKLKGLRFAEEERDMPQFVESEVVEDDDTTPPPPRTLDDVAARVEKERKPEPKEPAWINPFNCPEMADATEKLSLSVDEYDKLRKLADEGRWSFDMAEKYVQRRFARPEPVNAPGEEPEPTPTPKPKKRAAPKQESTEDVIDEIRDLLQEVDTAKFDELLDRMDLAGCELTMLDRETLLKLRDKVTGLGDE